VAEGEHELAIILALEGGAGEVTLSEEHSDFHWVTPEEVSGFQTAYYVGPAMEAFDRPS
jgi:hypothetical protein